jgi:hypothetical protein
MNARADWTPAELRLVLDDVPLELEDAVAALGFVDGIRTFPADSLHATAAAARFPSCADAMVRQAARLAPADWEDALELLLVRAPAVDWWLAGSAALAVRGVDVAPRDLDLVSDARGATLLAGALADILIEPLVDGGWLAERWFRAFEGARIECVGGVHPAHDDPEPCDFGRAAAARLESVRWRDWEVRVPPLELQLASRRRRGLA